MIRRFASFFAFALVAPVSIAAIIGTNPPARPLTPTAIATLPAAEQAAWQQYLARSRKQAATDSGFLTRELRSAGLTEALVPEKGGSLSLDHTPEWFGTEEARRIADHLVSFQTPAGGWSKNTAMAERPRRTGERFGFEAGYDGTFDNDGTIHPLRFLAKTITGSPTERSANWRAAFFRGIEYTLAAQYPNGGWPQVWPLVGEYHDSITFNDGAMSNIMRFLRDVASGRDEFSFVPAALRQRADASVARGIECVLASQIIRDGKLTAWCQQHDLLTLAPTSARNYEMIAQSTAESAGLMLFLIELPNQNPSTIRAVHAAASWLERTALHDLAYKHTAANDGRHLVPAPGAGRIWARYCEIGSNRPLFGDRDKTIHDNVDEISRERRDGYAWFVTTPENALKRYAVWAKKYPAAEK